MEGNNNSQTYTEETGKTVTKVGTGYISTTQKANGNTSVYLANNSYLSTPSHDDFNFGNGDFTIILALFDSLKNMV